MNETIAAVSTASGPAMRAVIRISGPEAFEVGGRMLAEGPSPSDLPGFSAPVVALRLPHGGSLSARMLTMRAPRSYTTEDVVEFHLFGAPALAEAVLAGCLDAGAVPAGPGAFTQRAFLGGRIDSAQVEGVLQLIESRSDGERRAALNLLQGRISDDARRTRTALVEALAAIEAYLDFLDEDTEAFDRDTVQDRLRDCMMHLEHIDTALSSKATERGWPRVVLLGAPNAGKSSLFNALVSTRRAILSDRPGTTRDVLEGEVRRGDRSFLLYDAPGVIASHDPLERLAISQLRCRMDRMDAALLVLDGSGPFGGDGLREIHDMVKGKPFRYVMNKCDLPRHASWERFKTETPPIPISARTREGIDPFLQDMDAYLPSLMPDRSGGEAGFALGIGIRRALQAIRAALEEDWEGGLELVAMEIRAAMDALGPLALRLNGDEILNKIFSRFCIGK